MQDTCMKSALKRSRNICMHCSTNRDAQSSRTLKLAKKNLKHVTFTHLAEAKAMLQPPKDSCLLGCDQKYLLLKPEMHCLYLSLAEIHLLSHSSHCISMYTERCLSQLRSHQHKFWDKLFTQKGDLLVFSWLQLFRKNEKALVVKFKLIFPKSSSESQKAAHLWRSPPLCESD